MPLSRIPAELATTPVSFRNRIINGDMRIDQRNAGASVSVPNGGPKYGVDRFQGDNSTTTGVTYSLQRVSDAPSGFSNSLLATVTAAGTTTSGNYQYIRQNIEGFNFADLMFGTAGAQSFTLSFWVKSSITGTHAGYLGAALNNRFRVFTYTINAANTWEFKTVTITGDTSGTWDSGNGTGLQVAWSLACGSSYQGSAGAWGGSLLLGATGQVQLTQTNGATFYITGVQLEAGTVATPFERRDYGRELIMCQRYFETSFGDGTAPSNGSSTSFSTENGIAIGVATNRLSAGTSTSFSVKKRAQPTITTYGNSSGYWAWVSPSGTAYTFSVNVNPNRVGTGAFGFNQQVVDGALVVCFGHWTASAEL